MIRFEHVGKRYGRFTAVKDLDFAVSAGEVFGFLGPNGAGKTTTLRMVTGLIQPTRGRIFIGRHDLAREPIEAKALMGFIPDRPYLYEKLSALELLRFVAGLYRLPRAEAAPRITALLEQFELVEWATTLVENFSHGMKQRLVFAAALLTRPSLLVVDEPMVGLDPRGMRLVKQIFRDLCAQEGMTVFLSTHTLDIAEDVCDRIAIIHRGDVVAMGDMPSLREAAGAEGGKLEEVFFELTDGGHEATEGEVA